ncbi:type I-E CRISPR-associated protein Cse2/CasB [Treponema sp.]
MEVVKESRQEWYVRTVIERIKKDTAMAAALKKGDNPATEFKAWEYLADYKVDLEMTRERIPYLTVSAALARAKPSTDGFLSIGQAIARSGKDGVPGDQERARLRRLLACDTIEEVCLVLRHLLSLLASRNLNIAYGKLLTELVWFEKDPQRTKARWAQSFFRNPEEVS